MSGSYAVRLRYTNETTPGITPPAPIEWAGLRHIDEALNGEPQTGESAESRPDRLSNGLIVLGLNVAGPINGELWAYPGFFDWVGRAMKDAWSAADGLAGTITIDAAAGTLSYAAGDVATKFAIGDCVQLVGPGWVANQGKIARVVAAPAA